MKTNGLYFLGVAMLSIVACSKVYYFQIDGSLESISNHEEVQIVVRAENGSRPTVDFFKKDEGGKFSYRFHYNNLLPSEISFIKNGRIVQRGLFIINENERSLSMGNESYTLQTTKFEKEIPGLIVEGVIVRGIND